MIDKFSLTTFRAPDKEHLMAQGNMTVDEYRKQLYKFLFRLDKAVVFTLPHKFSEMTNANIPFAKIDLNPKRFECYNHMLSYLAGLFDVAEIDSEGMNVTRADIAVDIENFPIEHILSILHVQKIRPESFSIYKGTIYAGIDPKIRIYNKTKELKSLLKRGFGITEHERGILESGKVYTRFEVQIRSVKKNLKELSQSPADLVSYYDRLDFFSFGEDVPNGIMQYLYRLIPRKSRNELEKFKDHALVTEIKERFIASVNEWFSRGNEPF